MSALKTYSSFYYGHVVDTTNRYIDFEEGGPEITATIPIGSYTLTQFLIEVASAMNDVGANTYTFSVNRTTRIVTLSSTGSFELLGATGSNSGQNILNLLGFAAVDSGVVTSIVGTSPSGSSYLPQFFLQDYLPTSLNKKSAFASVNKSASGKVSVQQFGEERFMECNIKYITDIPQSPNGPLQTDINAVSDATTFMEYIINKYPIEFMPNKNAPTVFNKVILERTPESQDGTSYRLSERFGDGLPYYYDTGKLIFREITE